MARLARVVVAGVPHHVTQRGNRRQQTFFSDADYEAYRALLAEGCRDAGVAVWAYCLMPNHVHLILVPSDEGGLRAALGEAHRRYSRRVNFREGWRGYLWQGRFASVPMDGAYLLAAARYVELNPVRARLAAGAGDWPWSSARAHLAGRDDGLVAAGPLLEQVGDWAGFLDAGLGEAEHAAIRAGERTGRPLGSAGLDDTGARASSLRAIRRHDTHSPWEYGRVAGPAQPGDHLDTKRHQTPRPEPADLARTENPSPTSRPDHPPENPCLTPMLVLRTNHEH